MAVITISRQFGAGGWTLGEKLAKRLGYRCVNEQVIRDAAEKMNVSREQIQAFEKDGASKLMKFIDKMVPPPKYIERLISEQYGYVEEIGYVDAVKKIIEELHVQDNVVIIGRGGQYILKGRENVLHILLVQYLDSRIQFMMERYNLNESSAKKAIKRKDESRKRFLSFFSDERYQDDPLLYDLVINMDRLGLDRSEELICSVVAQMSS